MPYVGGRREVGCVNLVDNLEDNHGLQVTVAVLEKLYLEADFPPGVRSLEDSPRNLGVSRADLWAFTALVALDRLQARTAGLCREHLAEILCSEAASQQECFAPFPWPAAVRMFRTGRTDCQAHRKANQYQQFVASRLEDHPDNNGNGERTVAYFRQAFGLTGREGLALLGAHSIGRFHPLFSRNAYQWVRPLGGEDTRAASGGLACTELRVKTNIQLGGLKLEDRWAGGTW